MPDKNGIELITPENLRMWIESAKQDLRGATRTADREFYKGQIFAYEHILETIEHGFDGVPF